MAAVDYGRDTSVTTGRRSGRIVSGLRLLGEAAFRRITTPRGMLRGGRDEANYGLDVCELLGSVDGEAGVKAMAGRIELELRKDQRFLRVDVSVAIVEGDSADIEAEIDVAIVAAAGPFTLKLRVDEVTAEMVGFKEAA